MRRQPVVLLALFIEKTEAFGAGKERTCVIVFAEAAAKLVEWSVEIDNANAGGFEQRTVGGLDECSTTEGHDGGIAVVESVEKFCECVGFHLAKGFFAEFAKDGGDGAAAAGFDLAVEIDEAPAEALGKSHADGGLAGAHEPDEDDGAGVMSVAAWDGLRLDRHLLHLRVGLREIPLVNLQIRGEPQGLKPQ